MYEPCLIKVDEVAGPNRELGRRNLWAEEPTCAIHAEEKEYVSCLKCYPGSELLRR